jgi:beta-lactamase regulating signal transducer with metallopeptidase domain
MIGLILDHLWQSTLFVAAAGLLTLFFRTNSAGVRYGIWLCASLKFFFPLALLTAGGTAISNLLPRTLPPPPAMTVLDGVAQPFSSGVGGVVQAKLIPVQPWDWTTTLAVIWLIGFFAIVTLWFCRWLNLRAIARSAAPVAIAAPLPVRSSSSLLEPGLVGIFRPVLLLPAAICDQLSTHELDTVIAHELCHWRRRDNLTAALHMLVEALFWFHPLVWWLETRLIAERERACDEAVLAAGREPELYAQSILKVCKSYVQSPLTCVAGISGADLKPRLERIMQNRAALHLNLQKKALLTTVAMIAVVAPLLAGLMGGREALAQTTERLDGWRQFKFGMPVDQARAMPSPGMSWRYFPNSPGLLARGPVREFGFSFENAGLEFTQKHGLVFIGLDTHKTVSTEEATTSEACEDTFRNLLLAVEAQYGTFEPRERNAEFTSFPETKNVVHDIAGTNSQYLYSTNTRDTPSAYSITMSASRASGARYVEVITRYANSPYINECRTQVIFEDPSKESPRPARKPA